MLTDDERQVMDWSKQGAQFALRMLENDPEQARPAVAELLTLLRDCPDTQAFEILNCMVNLTGRLALMTDNVPQLKLWLRLGVDAVDEVGFEAGMRAHIEEHGG